MTAASRSIASALGITAIAMLWVCGPLIEPRHYALLHWSKPAWQMFLPVLLDFLLCWALFAALLHSAGRPGVWRRTLWLALLLLLPWLALKSWQLYSAVLLPAWTPRVLLILSCLSFLLLTIAWQPRWNSRFERVIDGTGTVLSFLGVTGALLLVQVLLVFHTSRHLNESAPAAPLRESSASPATPPKPRILWILLDELPQAQVFDQRPAGVALPAFDAFAAQSTMFTQVKPVELLTERVVPSLLIGQRSDNTRSAANGDVYLHHPGGEWFAFDGRQSLFADAHAAGYQTGIAGWHNPYCRMMSGIVDRCFWTFRPRLPNGMSSGDGLAVNMFSPLQQLGGYGFAERGIDAILHLSPIQQRDAQLHIDDVRTLSSVADTLLTDQRLNFILLHLPAPHPTGIYDRRRHQFVTSGGSFVDNLVLANDLLAHIRSVLESQGEWDRDAIVVCGDHGWRVKMWRRLPGWTAEGERASHGGVFDTRPALMVKLPGQNAGQQVNEPISLLAVHEILEQLLHGHLRTTDDLLHLAGQPPPAPQQPAAAH